MSKNRFELDKERLATTDEHGYRVYLHPEEVQGVWKNRRTIVYWSLIVLYLVLPWIYIKGKPALMLNIFKREFTFFGSTYYGVDPILVFLVVISCIFFIAFLTSLFGRVWCGWGCPQTVFIQSIFLKIETFIEGSARKRRELEQAPMSFSKFIKKSLKWTLFTLVSAHIAHTFVGYFVGPRELLAITLQSPMNNLGLFTGTMIITGIFLFDFGWFKEQFCIIMCPYGRIQSVIMDINSLVISYDKKRGEPRRGLEGVNKDNQGDCINCYNCVKVCPTGIDIRRGTQLECIACTNCIDACDDIMTKLKKPTGLIRYASENEMNGEKRKLVTPRSIIYVLISCIFISLFAYLINRSTNVQMFYVRGAEAFTQRENEITNRFNLKINHQGGVVYKANLRIQDEVLKEKIKIITPTTPMLLDKAEKKAIVFFRFDKSLLERGTKKIIVEMEDAQTKEILSTKEVNLVGPVD